MPEGLTRVARGEAALTEALLTLAHHGREQARTAADLLERETWALTVILDQSAPIWQHLADPILRFPPERSDQPRLELGTFSHLAALIAPSEDEQVLISASTPHWAQVSPALGRLHAQQTGALACSYVAISTAEAISIVGFGRILSRLAAATRSAGQVLATQAQSQHDRAALLLQAEQMLGVAAEPSTTLLDDARAIHTSLLLLLLRPVTLPGAAQVGTIWMVVVILAFFLVNFSPLLFLLLLAAGLVPVQLYLGAEQARRADRREWRSPHNASQAEHSSTDDHGTVRDGGAHECAGARSRTIRLERFYR